MNGRIPGARLEKRQYEEKYVSQDQPEYSLGPSLAAREFQHNKANE
jgi:hypothetical protein